MRDSTKRVTALQRLPIDKRTRRKTSPHLYIAAAHAQIRGPSYFLGGKIGPFGPIFYGTDFGVSKNVYMIGASLSEPHLGPYGGCGLSHVRPACAKFTWTAFQVQRSVEAGQLEKRPG